MKKVLLTATALMSASVAFADSTLNVGLSGGIQSEAGVRSQKALYKAPNLTPEQRTFSMSNKVRASVKAEGKADNGLVYGGVAALVATAASNSGYNSGTLDKTYLYVESMAGRVEAGSNYSASKTMKVDAGNIARATGGASDGNWINYVNVLPQGANASAASNMYHLSSDLLSDSMVQNGTVNTAGHEATKKVTFYSPSMYGLTFGVSYTPDTSSVGGNSPKVASSTSLPRDFKNVLNGGVSFARSFDQLEFRASLTGEMGKSSFNPAKDARATHAKDKGYAVGASLAYANLAFAGSVGHVNKSGLINTAGSNATPALNQKGAKYWTAGAAYTQGPVGTSVTYFSSNLMKNKLSNLAVAADYQLAPGFAPYAEYNSFAFTSSDKTIVKNKGSVMLFGANLQF